jgi:hypothetical protein
MGEGFCMTKSRRFIDYDKIEEWSPWLDEIICGFAPKNLVRARIPSSSKMRVIILFVL